MFIVQVDNNRPDFRVFIDLLYGFEHNVDTDGDSHPVNSRTWTELYIKDRESQEPPVYIFEEKEHFVCRSDFLRLEETTAVYLYSYCGSTICHKDVTLAKEEIEQLKKKYIAELTRAENSIWHQSTDEKPYPNRS